MNGKKKISFYSYENQRLGKRMNEKEIKLKFQSQSKIIVSLTSDCSLIHEIRNK